MGIPVAGSDPAESQPTVGDSGAADFAADWKTRGQKVTEIGHRTVNFDISATGPFPDSIKQSIFKIAQACTTTGAGLTAAGNAAQTQAENDEEFQKDYKDKTEVLTKAVAAKQQALAITAMGGSPAYMTSAQASESAARAARQAVLDGGVTKTQGTLDCLPEHGRQAVAAQQAAYDGLTLRTGYETPAQTAAPTQVAPRVAPTGNNNGANPKPNSGTPAKPSGEKPTGEPTENKNAVDENAGKPTTPQQNQPQGQQLPTQQQGQQGAPQAGGAAAPAGGAPAGGQGAKPSSTVPVPAVQPIRTDSGSRGGGGVRPATPPTTPSSNNPIGKGGGVIGSGSGGGSTATPAGGTNAANKAGGGIGSGAGGGTTSSNNSSGMRGGMGMMGGAGAGAGHGSGGQARPKGEVKADPADKRLRGEDVAEQALGGVARDGDDGKPVTPPVPGSNGKAPTPPPIPPKP